MNIDDLRRELRSRATEPGATSMDDRLAGVRGKVVAARRRKRAAGAAAALASLAVIGVIWSQLAPGGTDEVAESTFAPLPDQLNGDLLIEARYNDPGSSDLRWETTLDRRNVVATLTCQIPDGAELPKPDDPVQVWWSINGTRLTGVQCGELGSTNAHTTVVSRRAEWGDMNVWAGRPFEIELSLLQGDETVEVPGARFGVGLYEKTGQREHENGVVLTELLDLEGERYRLEDWEIGSFEGSSRQVRLRTPRVDGQIAVVYGWQAEQPAAPFELRQDGEILRSGYGGSIERPILIDGDTPHDLSLHASGSSVDGDLVIAYYVLEE